MDNFSIMQPDWSYLYELVFKRYFVMGLFAFVATKLFMLFFERNQKGSSYFRNEEGIPMVEVATDSRFRRFAHGSELSEEGYKKANGNPYIVWNGSTREVVLSSPEHTRDFYHGDGKDHLKPAGLNMGQYFERILGLSAGVQNGEQWKTTRSNFDPFFSHSAAINFYALFSIEIKEWLKELSNSHNTSLSDADNFDVDALDACRILPFKLIAYSCYGREIVTEEVFQELLALNTVHEQLMTQAIFGKSTISKWIGLLPTSHKRKMDQFQKEWEAFNMKILNRATESGVICPVASIYSNVYPNGSMTKKEYLQTIDEILFTNIDVTSSVLAFLLINIAATESVQEQLREEIAQYSSRDDGEGFESYITKTGTFLEHTCMESIRLCPATWFSLPESSPNPKRISGYLIPPKTPFIIDWKRLNTQSPVWNKMLNPNQKEAITGMSFSPERFASLSPSQYRYSFLRYGLGPRKCIGKNFAGIIMKIMLVEVLGSYQLQFRDQDKFKLEQRAFNIRDDRFTITPQQTVRFVKIGQ